jgi:Na+/proline symporter
MKTFGLSVLAAIGGYLMGLFGGMLAIETFSSNRHDKSLEAAMTGAFVFGPLMAVVAVMATVIFRSRHRPHS